MLANRFALPMARRLEHEMNQLFNSFGEGAPFFSTSRVVPPVNVWEDGDNLYAEAEVPGLTMNDLDIFVVGNELTIKGSRNVPTDENATFHRCERGSGEFNRILSLPVPVNAERVEASLNHGVLLVTMPKAEEAKPRKITIKSA